MNVTAEHVVKDAARVLKGLANVAVTKQFIALDRHIMSIWYT